MSFTIAIQRRGKLRESSEKFLNQNGIIVFSQEHDLIGECTSTKVRILYLRDDDIPEYVLHGAADFGIVGQNVLAEKSVNLQINQSLGFGECRLVIAVPYNSLANTIQDLQGERIATSYPKLLQQFLSQQNVYASIIPIQGSVEIAPQLNLADAICDITQSGKTLQQYNLRIIETVFYSEAVLISNTNTTFTNFAL